MKSGLATFLHAELDEATKKYGEVKKTAGAIAYKETINTNNYKHYEDNEVQWTDSSFKDGEITLTTGDAEEAVFAELLGRKKKTIEIDGKTIDAYEGSIDDIPKPVGFGLVETIRLKEGNFYGMKFFPKITFRPFSGEGKTKNENNDYSTQDVTADIQTLDGVFYCYKRFGTAAEAIEALYAMFGKPVPPAGGEVPPTGGEETPAGES